LARTKPSWMICSLQGSWRVSITFFSRKVTALVANSEKVVEVDERKNAWRNISEESHGWEIQECQCAVLQVAPT